MVSSETLDLFGEAGVVSGWSTGMGISLNSCVSSQFSVPPGVFLQSPSPETTTLTSEGRHSVAPLALEGCRKLKARLADSAPGINAHPTLMMLRATVLSASKSSVLQGKCTVSLVFKKAPLPSATK